ncbi:MAG: methylated-DNA--[protein]-cysteine S-methyltransferase [Bacteroidales bacterium]
MIYNEYIFSDTLSSPIGTLYIQANEKKLLYTGFCKQNTPISPNSITHTCKTQLLEYFSGQRTIFNLPLYFTSSDFAIAVYRQCIKIPYGTIITYSDIASHIGTKSAIAVGQALKRNPFLIIVPCHRVFSKTHMPTGYVAGLWRKEWLTHFETTHVKNVTV